ncbi:MAG TPA: hypothetical protein VNO52_14795 [Methylomirabilota bacterium]|nr:hypothetical protein [Methylomirabilota bacterium]
MSQELIFETSSVVDGNDFRRKANGEIYNAAPLSGSAPKPTVNLQNKRRGPARRRPADD